MRKSRCDVSKKSEKLFFKKIPVTMRSHLHELTGNELKVWMYFHLRSGADATSYPSNKLIAQETGINIETVKLAKAKLRKLGWLEAGEQRKRADGSFSTVVEKTHLPWVENPATDNGKPSHGTVGGKNRSGKNRPAEVDTKSFSEVTATPIQKILEGQNGVSELVSQSEAATPLELPDGLQAEEKSKSKSNEPTNQEEWDRVWGSLPLEVRDLMGTVTPVILPKNTVPESEAAVQVLKSVNGILIHALHLLSYNRTHKTGGLYIRSCRQWAKALDGTAMMNDYLTHDFDRCKICRAHGVPGLGSLMEGEGAGASGKTFDVEAGAA